MNEMSTAGVTLKYAVEQTAGTRPVVNFTVIPCIKSIPDFNPEPATLEVTDLSDKVWKRYIKGLKDIGGALGFDANLTDEFKTAWETLVSAAETAKASSKATWFEVAIPNFDSFYFAGEPSELGMSAMNVDEVMEITAYIAPEAIHGWDDASTTSP